MFWLSPSCPQCGPRVAGQCVSGCWSSECRWSWSGCCVYSFESGRFAGHGLPALWPSKERAVHCVGGTFLGSSMTLQDKWVWIDHHDRCGGRRKLRNQCRVTATGLQATETLGPVGGFHSVFPCARGAVISSSDGFRGQSATLLSIYLKKKECAAQDICSHKNISFKVLQREIGFTQNFTQVR